MADTMPSAASAPGKRSPTLGPQGTPAVLPAAPVAALAVRGEGRHAARHVALRRLDLDNVRAEVGEEHRAEGAGEGLRQVEDAEVGERARWACHRAAQWLRRFTRTVRTPSKTT